jgi:hypothetical protein
MSDLLLQQETTKKKKTKSHKSLHVNVHSAALLVSDQNALRNRGDVMSGVTDSFKQRKQKTQGCNLSPKTKKFCKKVTIEPQQQKILTCP